MVAKKLMQFTGWVCVILFGALLVACQSESNNTEDSANATPTSQPAGDTTESATVDVDLDTEITASQPWKIA